MELNGLQSNRGMKMVFSGGSYMKYIIFFFACCLIFSLYTFQTKNEGIVVLSPSISPWTERLYDFKRNDVENKATRKYSKDNLPQQNLVTSKYETNSDKTSIHSDDNANFYEKSTTVLSEKDKESIENIISNVQTQNLVTSGKLFKGDKIRKFPRGDIKFAGKTAPRLKNDEIDVLNKHRSEFKYNCDKWGVVTTIFEPPSEAVRRLMYRKDWCVVVAGDKGKPSLKNYKINTTIGERIVFLSEQDQIEMHLPFVDHLPWKTFGRKNVGYLYAISMGAKIIFDFDDDNLLKFWLKDASPDPVLDIDNFSPNGGIYSTETVYQPMVESKVEVFNPYPILGAPALPCWPRGMPLDLILDEHNIGKVDDEFRLYQNESLTNYKESNFAVLQSLADIQPDVDAVYRLVRGTPFSFERPNKIIAPSIQKALGEKEVKSRPILKIPTHTMTPYNAQATIFFETGFWSLYLPITVVGRVSDIWRSYFAQALFKSIGVELGFLPRPVVVQDRNPHSYLADFDAEIPLYEKSSVLVPYLLNNYVKNNTSKATTFIEILERLWIDLYEREYIEIDDVINMQLWIETLIKIGYQFPEIKTSPDLNSAAFKSVEILPTSLSDIKEVRTRISEIGHSINSEAHTQIPKTKNQRCNFNKQFMFGLAGFNDAAITDTSLILANMNQLSVHVGPRNISEKYSKVLHTFPQNQYFNENISYPFSEYTSLSTNINEFWSSMTANSYLSDKIDAFICNYPARMCQLWIPVNKSVIFMPSHRYNLGMCGVDEWKKLNEDVKTLSDEALDKGHVIGALSRYDVEYLKYYTGIQADLVPSYSGFYVNIDSYQPDQRQIAIISPNSTNFKRKIVNTVAPEFSFTSFNDMTNGLPTKELGKYSAVVLIPTDVVSYSLTELYALTIPLFVPSIKFFLNYHEVSNCSGLDTTCSNYRTSQGFKKEHFGFSMSRISTSATYCVKNQKVEKDIRPDLNELKSIHPYSPNLDMAEDAEAESYWLQLADFYEWPHIKYFDSYDELKELLLTARFESIHAAMKQELVIRKDTVMNQWCNIVQKIYDAKLSSI